MPVTALAVIMGFQGNSASKSVSAVVTVEAQKTLARMPEEGLGIGVAVWDEYMTHPAVPMLIRDAGFRVIRFPGGSYSDLYHWKTHTATKGQEATIRPGVDFDNFMAMTRKSKAQALITVNYGSNPEGTGGADPAEAAEWVRYANKVKKYGIKYWEIGNEVYGNGFYNGSPWEVDLHAPLTGKKEDRLQNPLLGPKAYATNLLAFVKAMKKEDPSIKIGAILTTPGGWPDGVAPDWNSTVLSICGKEIDFVVVHWYGEGRSPQAILDSHKQVVPICDKLKSLIAEHCGGRKVQIWMTEGDASGWNTRHPGALFAANHFPTWIKAGATHINWWNLHNGATKAFDGTLDDQGILSNGSSVDDLKEPSLNTPFPPYYGVQMVDRLIKPGDHFVAATSDRSSLVVHAARARNGQIRLMLINQDSENAVDVTIGGVGSRGTRFDYGPGDKAIRKSAFRGNRITVPKHAITTLAFEAAR